MTRTKQHTGHRIWLGVLLGSLLGGGIALAQELPIDLAAVNAAYEERHHQRIRNAVTIEQLWNAVGNGDETGLAISFSAITQLTDGTTIDPAKIYGSVYAGPYPFESAETDYVYKRFRARARVRRGQGQLKLQRLFEAHGNSEDWSDTAQLCVRFHLYLAQPEADRALGTYDTFLFARRTETGFAKLPSIMEGPCVGMVSSDDPTSLRIALRTSTAIEAQVILDDGRSFTSDGPARSHEIAVTGLRPATTYSYRVRVGTVTTPPCRLQTAPPPGAAPVTFAYSGDSREGYGGAGYGFMGHNQATLERLMNGAHQAGAQFFIFGGDLINGGTSSVGDFAAQLQAWKQSVAGFWRGCPIYPCIGNHEALLRVFRSRERGRVAFDRWPYASASAEAVFGAEFMNPRNGPRPSDPRRPTYEENVFSFQYGPVLCIAFNNNYWVADGSMDFGGCPEGYILDDQLDWIEAQLQRADRDHTVRYVVLYGQEPVFPCGGHVDDAMWWEGDNRVRATTFTDGVVVPEEAGVVEVRNRFVRLVAGCAKVAAVLGADEHVYYRLLINRDVPIGDMSRDDRDGDDRIDWPRESCSPLGDLRYPTWYITCGGAGAPYYAEERAPWNTYWRERESGTAHFRFSSQENILLFRAEAGKLALKVLSPFGELIDEIDDLMDIKR